MGYCPFFGFFAHFYYPFLTLGFGVVLVSSGRRDSRMGWFGLARLLVGA